MWRRERSERGKRLSRGERKSGRGKGAREVLLFQSCGGREVGGKGRTRREGGRGAAQGLRLTGLLPARRRRVRPEVAQRHPRRGPGHAIGGGGGVDGEA